MLKRRKFAVNGENEIERNTCGDGTPHAFVVVAEIDMIEGYNLVITNTWFRLTQKRWDSWIKRLIDNDIVRKGLKKFVAFLGNVEGKTCS